MSLQNYTRYLVVGVGALVVLVLLGFGAKAAFHEITKERPHFSTGTVINRDYSPAHTEQRSRRQYAGEDCHTDYQGHEECSSRYITVWYDVYVPDDWDIQIQNCNVSHKDGTQWVDKEGQPKCFKKWIDVDQMSYNATTIGEQWN